MRDNRQVGGIQRHMQALPGRRRQEAQPEVVTCGREQQHDEQGEHAENFERKTVDLKKAGIASQQHLETVVWTVAKIPIQRGVSMGRRDGRGEHTQMAAIVKQRQKPRIQPRGGTDRQDHRQQQKRTRAERIHAHRIVVERQRQVLKRWRDPQEYADIDANNPKGDRIVNDLGDIPANGNVTLGHFGGANWICGPSVGPTGRSARDSSTIAGSTPARTSQITRCVFLWPRLMDGVGQG